MTARPALLLAALGLCACGPRGQPAPQAPDPTPAATPAPPASARPAVAMAQAPAAESYVLPGDFAPDTRVAQLEQRYGKDAVRVGDVPGAEGETVHGAILFADDPSRRAYLYFEDAEALRGLQLVRVLDDGSRWHFADGIGIGTPLSRLVAMNGKPIRFLGFDWDYGGAVTDWNGGALAPAVDKPVIRQIHLNHRDAPSEAYPSGDSEFASDDPRWPRLGDVAVVGEIAVSFPGEDDL